jgi:hypothetical protein
LDEGGSQSWEFTISVAMIDACSSR